MRWSNPEPHLETMVDATKDMIENSGFEQLVTGHTRTWNHQTDSRLDHIWSNCHHRTLSILNEQRSSSDHNVIGIRISLKDIKHGGHNIVKRIWKKFDPKKFLADLREIDWNQILITDNIDIANTLFEDSLTKVLEVHAPMKTIQARTKFHNWISDQTKIDMKLRDQARDQARHSGQENDWQTFRRRRNDCTASQRRDKASHQRDLFSTMENNKDSASLFSMTKEILGLVKSGPPSYFKLEGRSTQKQQQLADWQADWYQQKLSDISNSIPQVCFDPLHYLKRAFSHWAPNTGKPCFVLRSVTMAEVSKMIAKLKNGHAHGRDKLDSTTIKLAAPVILPSVTHIINLSLCHATFPAKWKIARIVPVLKAKGLDTSHPKSFRPISQLPVISKLTERAVQQQLLTYLEDNKLLHQSHHAYRNKHSTITALTQMMDGIACGTDMNLITATMTLDLSSAFDCVRHSILLSKLSFYGLDKNTIDWISSYLGYRSSYVTVGSAQSSMRSAPHGVPQGSVIGPLLYLIYVNEMPTTINDDLCGNSAHHNRESLFGDLCNDCGTLTVYADDSQYQVASNSRHHNQDKIDCNFWKLGDYLNANGLQVNQSKTVLCEFMSHQKRAKISGIPPDLTVREQVTTRTGQIILQDKLISDRPTHRMLGLGLQNNLSMESHLSSGNKAILPAVRRQLGFLSRIRPLISTKAALLLVNSLALSKLSYAIAIWGNTTDNHLKLAQIVQNSAARLVTGKKKTTRQKDLLQHCGWLDMKEWTSYHSLLQIWKSIRWNIPTYLKDKITTDPDNKLTTHPPRLHMTSLTYRWQTIQKWNLLDTHLRMEPNLSKFKAGIRQSIMESRTDTHHDDSSQDIPLSARPP